MQNSEVKWLIIQLRAHDTQSIKATDLIRYIRAPAADFQD